MSLISQRFEAAGAVAVKDWHKSLKQPSWAIASNSLDHYMFASDHE
jgi:hypothetical protein